MFDTPSIEDMKVQPELEQSEKVIANTGVKLGDVLRENVVIVVTTERLLVRPKRGRSIEDEHSESANIEIFLEDIDVVRRTGAITKTIEIVCDEEVFELPPIQNASDDIIDAIVEQERLGKTVWGEESTAKRGTKQVAAGIIGLIGLLTGGIFVLLGIGGIVSIVGILLGIAFLIGGIVVVTGSVKLIKWGFNKEEEWNRKEPRNDKSAINNSPEHPSDVEEREVKTTPRIDERIVYGLGQMGNNVQEMIPPQIWAILILIACLLWVSLFGLLENETAFSVVLFTAWILLPIAIYLDSKAAVGSTEWRPPKWLYIIASLVPLAAPLFGVLWLGRRRKKTGSALS